MSEMVQNYQQEQALEQPTPEAARLARVSYVGSSGLQLIFDGEEHSDGKYYLCNPTLHYRSGDRVLVQKVGGSYIVICKVGHPNNPDDMAQSAKLAYYVYNMASGKANLEFYMDTRGIIWAHNVADVESRWIKITGTEGTPPNVQRPIGPYD